MHAAFNTIKPGSEVLAVVAMRRMVFWIVTSRSWETV
jgi:hypothetical protein